MQPATYNAATDLLHRNLTAERASKLAYIDPARRLTYAELHASACRVACMLRSLGIRREDRVGMIMLDTVDWPITFLGAILAGTVPVPLNTLLGRESYVYMLADSRAKALFVSAPLLVTIQPALEQLADLQNIIVVGGPPPSGMIDYT